MGRHSVISIRRPGSGPVVAADQLRSAIDDFREAQYCRRRAEECQRQWEAGRESEIDHVKELAHTGDRRFRGRNDRELTTIGTIRWAQSTQAQRLRRREERYTRRAMLDLAFARFLTHLQELSGEGVPPVTGRTEADDAR
ncbi:hypothetical protein GCM10009557_31760 [Virgisporangium ochraceum]|uniref:Uncharacterized protein n=1 Tax=Virgisporangium ochraceum TaxID=65505 RepID=A0A8J4EEC1_9ACTN|nr:hypothetical protein [Virgisporangium ochraceum]GIJ71576.1 hypothetical protein Voc01_064930 [Virgisporangium ochraceum]